MRFSEYFKLIVFNAFSRTSSLIVKFYQSYKSYAMDFKRAASIILIPKVNISVFTGSWMGFGYFSRRFFRRTGERYFKHSGFD